MFKILKVIESVLNGVYFAFPSINISRYFRISHYFIHGNFQNQVLVVHASVASALISREPKQQNRETSFPV